MMSFINSERLISRYPVLLNGWYSAFFSRSRLGMLHRIQSIGNGILILMLSYMQSQGFMESVADVSQNSHQMGLVRAVLGAAFYPQYGQLLPPLKGQRGVKLLVSSQEKVTC